MAKEKKTKKDEIIELYESINEIIDYCNKLDSRLNQVELKLDQARGRMGLDA